MKRIVASLVTALAFLFGSVERGMAQEKVKGQKPEGAGIAGLVKKVDEKAGTITIATKTKEGPSDQTFALATDAKISVLGKPARLSEVMADKPVYLALNADKKVTAVSQDKLPDKGAKGEKGGIFGQAKKVDAKAGTITIAVVTQKGQPPEEQTFTLAADAKISVLGKPAKLEEVVTDKPVQLALNAEKKVTLVSQEKLPDKTVKGEKGAAGITGQLKKVDEKANTITLAVITQKGQPAEDQTFTLVADAKIVVFDKPAKLSDIKNDKPVQLKLDAEKKVIAVVQADAPLKGDKGQGGGISGLVKKIDDKAATITLNVVKVKGQPGEDQTFSIAANAKIVVFGKEARLSEVAADKPALIILNAEKKVVAVTQGKGEKPQK